MSDRGFVVWTGPSTPAPPTVSLTTRPHGPAVVTIHGTLTRASRTTLAAALLDAVTSRPNGVIVDLSAATPGHDLSPALAAALRRGDPWPHAPFLVVAEDWTRVNLAARTAAGAVDVVPTLAAARAKFVTRPWVSSAATVLRPPLTSRALARGLVLEFAEARGLRHRLDAAMLAADELTALASRSGGGTGRAVEVRLAARDGAIGVAVAEIPDDDTTTRVTGTVMAGGDEMTLVETVSDACGLVRRLDGGLLAWSVFTWGRSTRADAPA